MTETQTGCVKTAFLFVCGCLLVSETFTLLFYFNTTLLIKCSGNCRKILKVPASANLPKIYFNPIKLGRLHGESKESYY